MSKETELNSMPQEKQPEFFSYKIRTDRKLLPTDFSIREIATLHGLNFRTVRSYIWYTQVLRDFYADLPVNYLPGKRDNKRAVNPIPYELEPYFYHYITTASSLGYLTSAFLKRPMDQAKTGKHKAQPIYSKKEAEEMTTKFGKKLIANLYHYVQSDEKAPEYFKKALFQNKAFCDQAAVCLWETEFRNRCDLLIQLVNQCPINKRFLNLSHIIYFLDAEIGAFVTLSQREPVDSDRACRAFPSAFPKKLFQEARDPITRGTDDASPSYCLKEIDINASGQTLPLSKAFSAIEQKLDKNWEEYRTKAREKYQESLDERFSKSEFQEQFETLAEYLSRIRKTYSEEFLRRTALNLTFHTYRPYLQRIGLCQGSFNPKNIIPVDTKDPCTNFLQIYIERYHDCIAEENIYDYKSLLLPELRKVFDNALLLIPSQQDELSPADKLVALCETYFGSIRDWCWVPIYSKEKHTTVSSVLSLLSEYYENLCSAMHFETTGLLCPAVLLKEWMFIQAYFSEPLSKYLSGEHSDFPFPGSMLHEVLFFVRIHGYFSRDAQKIASIFQNYQEFMQKNFPSDSKKSV